jgi:3-hydroxyacyl-[acyl-carrier-protein] dehydratase
VPFTFFPFSPADFMPPQYLYDISSIDINRVLYDKEAIRKVIPHRGVIEQLDAIVYSEESLGRIIGYKDVRKDEFWVDGHIPGRPLYPGVLMIEASAQLASFYVKHEMKWPGFIGFGGVDKVRFRQSVEPGCRLHLILQKNWVRHGRFGSSVQGVVDGTLVYEGEIIGVQMG